MSLTLGGGLCKNCSVILIKDEQLDALEESLAIQKEIHDSKTSRSTSSACFEPWISKDGRWIRINHRREDTFPHFPNLSAAARAGCHFCSVLRQNIQKRLQVRNIEDDLSNKTLKTHICYYGYHRDDTLRIKSLSITWGMKEIEVYDDFDLDVHSPLGCVVGQYLQILHITIPATRTLSYVSGQIQRWLSHCNENHTCTDDAAHLPTRLIDVGKGSIPNPRLTISADMREGQPNLPYVALSYCWGDPRLHAPPPKTFQNNLGDRKHGIQLTSLPPCFKDAIEITHALAIQHIWIDSLCIVQDDKTDWEREVAMMGNVFKSAHITLVAAIGTSTRDRLYQHEGLGQPSVSLPFKSSTRPAICGAYSLYSWSNIPSPKTAYTYARKSVWGGRGWTFQEQALSRRTVYFGLAGLAFRCQQDGFTEGSTARWELLNNTMAPIRFPLYPFDGTQHQQSHIEESPPKKVLRTWYAAVKQYSRTTVTYPIDRLPALGGLARAFHGYWPNERYIAGIWSGSLAKGLLWFASPMHKIPVYVAPSWSWLSWTGLSWTEANAETGYFPVNARQSDACIKIICHITLAGDDIYGAITAGFLEVIEHTVFLIDSIRARKNLWNSRMKNIPFDMDCANRHVGACGFVDQDWYDRVKMAVRKGKALRVRLVAFPLGITSTPEEPLMDGTFPLTFFGLLLAPIQSLGEDIFERVGHCRISRNNVSSAPREIRSFKIV